MHRHLLLLCGSLLFTSCSRDIGPLAVKANPHATRTVTTTRLTPQTISEMVEAVGTVKSAHPTILAAKTVSTVTIDALGKQFVSTIHEILPATTPLSRTFLVKVALTTMPGLRSGLYGKAQFDVGQRSGIVVPASAVIERGQLQSLKTGG